MAHFLFVFSSLFSSALSASNQSSNYTTGKQCLEKMSGLSGAKSLIKSEENSQSASVENLSPAFDKAVQTIEKETQPARANDRQVEILAQASNNRCRHTP